MGLELRARGFRLRVLGFGFRGTPKVFWAVSAAIAVMANAPFASDALISA